MKKLFRFLTDLLVFVREVLIIVFVFKLCRTEWTENWGSWPHCNCNGQAGCWMHFYEGSAWCGCKCWWCRAARRLRPNYSGVTRPVESDSV